MKKRELPFSFNFVQKSGCNGFCDDEIYGQAIHYYEEKDIEVGKPLNCQVSVNHHIELTEEEKAQTRQEAIRQYQQACVRLSTIRFVLRTFAVVRLNLLSYVCTA